MSGDGYGLPGATGTAKPVTGISSVGSVSATAPSNAGATPSPTSAPSTTTPTPSTASSSGFQLATPTYGTNMMGNPAWVDDWAKAGSPDLNTWYQQQHGYMDMSKPLPTPDQPVFAPPPPPPAAVPAAPAPAAAPPPAATNWWSPKAGPAPSVTRNTLWGSSPVSAAELDALPDAFVASPSFLMQYGSSPSAQDYQRWRLGPEKYLQIQNNQATDVMRSGGYR